MPTSFANIIHSHPLIQCSKGLNFPVIVTDNEYFILFANVAALSLLGWSQEYLLGLPYWEITKPDPNGASISQIMEQVKEKGNWQGELSHNGTDGRVYVNSCISSHLLSLEKEEKPCLFHYNIDISERVKQEKQLRLEKLQAEGMSDAKSIFVSTMSHEIRTPMNGILGATDLLLSSELSAEDKECVEIIHHSTRSLIRIVNDILDFSKIESGQMKLDVMSIDPINIVHDVYKLLRYNAEDKGLQFNIKIPEGGPKFFVGDPLRIRQILLNLASNAIKFTPKGKVEIHLSYKLENENTYMCRFDVIDTGIGIHSSDIPKLFKNFSQLGEQPSHAFEGTGLGLSISKNIAQIMKGDIIVSSKQGQGSTFSFIVPLEKTEKKFLKKVVNLKELKRNYHKHILVVEDNRVNQQIIKKTLEHLGSKVTISSNGAEAIDVTKETVFDLILMDIRMPGIDGLQTTAFIRKETNPCHQVPIVAMTATALVTDKESAQKVGMNGFLEKPVRIESLVEILDKFFPA